MAAINDLINQIQDVELRERIQKEVNKLSKQKKFGLVFEEHMPECTPLYDMPIKAGTTVAKRTGSVNDTYKVLRIKDGVAACLHKESQETCYIDVADLLAVAEFGESIYPYLKPIDSVCNAPDSELWHTLIEADNYHALQLLEYLYAGKVDCIYIDPPYNTGAKDWKYNNDYVDGNDTYRHSKWLSFMQKRLSLAKKLLNPKDSVLIVTIDEKEYLHLGCLLEEMFPEATMQMVSTIIKPEGTNRFNEFSRTNEYIYFLLFGNALITPSKTSMFTNSSEAEEAPVDTVRELEWRNLRRRENTSVRSARPNQFYPIFINSKTGCIQSIGEALELHVDRHSVPVPDGCYALYPLTPDGTETLWGKHYESARQLHKNGYLMVSNGKTPSKAIVRYLATGTVNDIISGKITITGRGSQNEVIGHYTDGTKMLMPKSMWYMPSHNSQTNGSLLIKKIIGENRFNFPKSLYAVADCIRFFVANKPNALIVDFFAGSGTTLHAVNLLNAEDNGKRRCIMVTNNEVSGTEAKALSDKGYAPGDEAWNALGIARYVTWPRTVCSIKGQDIHGKSIKGNYLVNNLPMSDGFKSNAAFFQLSFLDKTAVALGMTFKEILPTLWMKAGAIGRCPELEGTSIPNMLILPENKMAVLVNENFFALFAEELAQHPEIQTVFLATDYDIHYRSMVKNLNVQNTYQLYRDYLDHFRLNRGRT